MAHTTQNPVFLALRTGLHLLFAALTSLVIVGGALAQEGPNAPVVALALVVLMTYGLGGFVATMARRREGRGGLLWLGALTLEWVGLVWLTPEAAYLVFPLFFLFLHLLGRGRGAAAVVLATGVAILALAIHGGWTVGGVVGPLVGACVALLIGLGYEALAREAEQREALMSELILTRGQLAVTEHESGVLAERARLAREIHDTLAQGLSSIQLLLHAAEGADPGSVGIEHIRLARETAAANLADARRFVRELTPPDLDEQGLGGVLRRLAGSQWAPQGVIVTVRVSDTIDLPMHLQAALLRIAQGAIANVIQHAHAQSATITLTVAGERLRFVIADDGQGFDPGQTWGETAGRSDSFGLKAIRERVDQLGGTLTIDAAPGVGAALTVDLALNGVA